MGISLASRSGFKRMAQAGTLGTAGGAYTVGKVFIYFIFYHLDGRLEFTFKFVFNFN